MRIGFDASKALKPRDGIGRYARELLRALAALDAGLEIELFGLPPAVSKAEGSEQLEELPFDLHSGWPVEADAIDIFHSTAWNVPPSFNGSMVFTCHDLTFLTHPTFHTLDNKVHCLTGLLRANLTDAHFLAVSKATAESLNQQLGIAGERVDVIHHAPSPDLRPIPRQEARQHLRERWQIQGAPVLAVGTLEPRKNLARLIERPRRARQGIAPRAPPGDRWRRRPGRTRRCWHVVPRPKPSIDWIRNATTTSRCSTVPRRSSPTRPWPRALACRWSRPWPAAHRS